MTENYWGSEQWMEHMKSAEAAYKSEMRWDGDTIIVEATSDTMTRYTVICSWVPEARIGGKMLVAVLHPWYTVYPADYGPLDVGYVVSKWKPRDTRYDAIHGGDAVCVSKAVNEAIEASLGAH